MLTPSHPAPAEACTDLGVDAAPRRLGWWRRLRIFFLEKELAILRDDCARYEMAEAIGPLYQLNSYEEQLRVMARIRELKGLPPPVAGQGALA